jgi:hypothetical protein
MNQINPGRFTVQYSEPFVVFLIGMRINRLWAVHKWLPMVRAMQPMISTLYRHPEKGFMGGVSLIGSRGPVMIQYWRSFEDLENFARNPGDPHRPAWQAFNRTLKNHPSVGIWHETYLVPAGQFEAFYGHMPRYGLGNIFEPVPVQGRLNSARGRMDPRQASEHNYSELKMADYLDERRMENEH